MTSEVSETVQSFLDGAARDLKMGRALLENGNFPEALSMARSALENTLKAIFVKATLEDPPSTRSLSYLARSAGIELPESVMDRLVEYTGFCKEEPYGKEPAALFGKKGEEFPQAKFSEMEGLQRLLVRELEAIY